MKVARFTPSVLDRLTQQIAISQTACSVQDTIAENIRCNLSALFNTRRYPVFVAAPHNDSSPALTTFGLPEMITITTDDEAARNDFLTIIARQISIFEPRLCHVNVSLSEKKQTSPRCLELMIEAELHCTHEQKTLAFRSVIDLSSHHIQLEEGYAERILGTLS